jgi:hypothetical protein
MTFLNNLLSKRTNSIKSFIVAPFLKLIKESQLVQLTTNNKTKEIYNFNLSEV